MTGNLKVFKLGDQHKVPSVTNTREVGEVLLAVAAAEAWEPAISAGS